LVTSWKKQATETVSVLVVDDDDAIRDILRAILETEGYAVFEAPDGQAALDLLHRTTWPMVVLTNHTMPHLDGPGLFHALWQDLALANRHAYIYMTAAERILEPAFLRKLEELHVPVLRKPFDIDELLTLLAQAAQRLAGS
jgi:two-component system response regulator AtoC